ncbi:Com family DNA-binding transcriptional regulator [Chromobacterium alkanivorans]|uniref:Com family DNA-binding transcriptional regulator n=1 Tax=Chromobacterium alkanivorans TaxID=1071719 RepID=UPI0019671054|nr:Com family DNA-binding transcriptional regulator [Chromobacterium alkanivorans]MBN3005587.1 Com family DNA-binding transcriptional regulator [Chromobacterium alkanivorans]
MQDIRCGHCQRKLAEGRYIEITIKCPRCRAYNTLKAAEPPTANAASVKQGKQHATAVQRRLPQTPADSRA